MAGIRQSGIRNRLAVSKPIFVAGLLIAALLPVAAGRKVNVQKKGQAPVQD